MSDLSHEELAKGVEVEPGKALNVVTEPTFDLTKIPDVMEAQTDDTGNPWTEGAKLMRRWFDGPVGGSPPDTKTITMDWLLRYERAKNDYQQILSKRLYLNGSTYPATEDLRKNIRKMFTKGGKVQLGKFGDLDKVSRNLKAGDIAAVKASYVNLLSCGGSLDTLDGLKAALGRWTLWIHVEGKVEETDQSTWYKRMLVEDYKATITRVGIHVRDSYDFEGWQPLGCWNTQKKKVGNLTCDGGTSVGNSDFRDWRENNQKGGDFVIFSDLKIEKAGDNATFFFNADD